MKMKRIIMVAAIAGLFALAPGCGAKHSGEGAGFPSFLDALGQLEDVGRGDGIVALVKSTVPILGADPAALDQAEYGFAYMANTGEYRKDVVVFGISGFLDIAVLDNKVSAANYYLSEHADVYDQDEIALLDNVISEYGSPGSVLYQGEPLDGIERIKDAYREEDSLSSVQYDCLWEDIGGSGHSFCLEKEFSVFQNRNLSHYIFS